MPRGPSKKLESKICERCHVDHVQGVTDPADRRVYSENSKGKINQPGSYRGCHKLYAAILRGDRNIQNFQLLCANCNWIKRYENNEHNNYGEYDL